MADHVSSLATDTGNKGHTGNGNTTARPLHSTLPRFNARMRAEADVAPQSHCGVWDCMSQHPAAKPESTVAARGVFVTSPGTTRYCPCTTARDFLGQQDEATREFSRKKKSRGPESRDQNPLAGPQELGVPPKLLLLRLVMSSTLELCSQVSSLMTTVNPTALLTKGARSTVSVVRLPP